MPYATPLIFKSNFVTKTTLKNIFRIEKKPTTKLEILVFCKPTNKPVIIYKVNSPGAE